MISDIQAKIDATVESVLSVGDQERVRMSPIGNLWTAGWIERLTLAGKVFTIDLGAIAATSHSALTGNAAPDLDQPEIALGVDDGFLIPLEFDINIVLDDFDGYDDILQIAFYGDRTQGLTAGDQASGTVETALPSFDGGPAFTGRAASIITADITDPSLVGDYLGGKFFELTQLAAEVAGTVPSTFNFHKKFEAPVLLAGPASLYGYVTGTNTPTFMGSVRFAHIPASWAPTPS